MFRRFTSNDMAAEQRRGKLYCIHFNSWLSDCGLAALLREGQWSIDPPLNIRFPNVGFGQEYQDAFRSWYHNGAVADLVKACDADGKRFTYGSFGSVWMDVTLTGKLPDGTSKAKEERIALMPKEPAVLAPKTKAVRVVDGKAKVVKVIAPADDGGGWVLSGGEQVPEDELYPVHKLTDAMEYLMVMDPTMDHEETF